MIVPLAALLVWLAEAGASPIARDTAVSFDITSGSPAPINDPAPVGISFEFFAFPEYLNELGGRTRTCLANLDGLTGVGTRIRIGGTTQDRATYDSTLNDAVDYHVAAPTDAPANLTYGPSFFDLAGSLSGPTVIGLNRRLNNLENGIAAAKEAINRMANLDSLELGNEPDREYHACKKLLHVYSASDPIANGSGWSPSADITSQLYWQSEFSSALGGKTDFIEAGVYLQPPKFSIQNLAPAEQKNLPIVKTFADHSYPQSACGGSTTDLAKLMDHPGIVQYVAKFKPEVEAAKVAGRPIVFGETNSATCGGGGISPTFGAGLWIVDYMFQSVILGYERLYFHHGTVGNSPYSWWGANNVFAPYYGAYFAAAALSHADHISQLDTSSTDLAAYALSSSGTVTKLAVLNMAYYPESSGNATRPSQAVSFSGLPTDVQQVSVKRLTAPYSTSLTQTGAAVTFYGHSFSDSDCGIAGTEKVEWVQVESGSIQVVVAASEAILVEW